MTREFTPADSGKQFRVDEQAAQPEPIPTDPEQAHDITCAHCGVSISFAAGEVFVNGPSYVCAQHAAPYTNDVEEVLPADVEEER